MALASLMLVSSAPAADAKAKQSIKAPAAADTKVKQATKSHRLLIQVDQNDPAVMNLALNNATNVIEYYRSKGEEVAVDVVTYGPGLHMLRADTSPVQDRIKQLKSVAFPSTIQFSACNNTKEGMEKKEGHPIDLLPDAVPVPSGVIHLMEMQEEGWSYIRP
jgi:intracellular sulfur oxidation DsrE/DsrF family protein